MGIELKNDVLSICVKAEGAELCSIVLLANNTEFMWQAGSEWSKHSPILFPIVGTLKDGEYVHNGNKYNLSRHGFARDREFQVLAQTEDAVTFQLLYDEDSLAIYPFKFDLSVHYQLQDATLTVCYEVRNLDDDTMYFSIGAHPAFKVPIQSHLGFQDYQLSIDIPSEQSLPISIYPLTEAGLTKVVGMPYLKSHQQVIPLHPDLFKKDAMVFKGMKAAVISLESTMDNRKLTFVYTGFPYLGLWNAYGAPFVCIEPWAGITDSEQATGILKEKEGINALAPGGKWEASWMVGLA